MALKVTDSMENLHELAQDDALRGTVIVSMSVIWLVIAGIIAMPFWIMVLLGLSPLVWIVYGVWFGFYAVRIGQIMAYVLKRETVVEPVDELDQGEVDGVAKRWRL